MRVAQRRAFSLYLASCLSACVALAGCSEDALVRRPWLAVSDAVNDSNSGMSPTDALDSPADTKDSADLDADGSDAVDASDGTEHLDSVDAQADWADADTGAEEVPAATDTDATPSGVDAADSADSAADTPEVAETAAADDGTVLPDVVTLDADLDGGDAAGAADAPANADADVDDGDAAGAPDGPSDAEAAACVVGADCPAPQTDCGSWQCLQGQCDWQPFADGMPCGGNACTPSATCENGACILGAPAVCDDQNPCTIDGCDPATGCTTLPADDTACSDGNACTLGDHCQAGACQAGSLGDCADGNACTTDGCDPATGCLHDPNSQPCQDGNACTQADLCQNGACSAGSPVSCADMNPCTDDSCNPLSGCTLVANSNSCDDGNACTGPDTCVAQLCLGATVTCDDSNPCTDDACDAQIGCTHSDNVAACNDGNACSKGDQCSAGVCAGAAYTCAAADPCHQAGVCQGDGSCTFANKSNGTSCSDGNACTSADACQGGVCQGKLANFQTDANNCGACGFVCSTQNGSAPKCASGVCTLTCTIGYGDCNAAAATSDGCESDLFHDAQDCGACGNQCSVASANSVAACHGGGCTFDCSSGTTCTGLSPDSCLTASATNGFAWMNPLPDGLALHDAWIDAGGDAYVVGARGTVLHRSAGLWATELSGTTSNLLSVSGTSAAHVVIGGSGGTVLSRNGASWTKLPLSDTGEVYTVYADSDTRTYLNAGHNAYKLEGNLASKLSYPAGDYWEPGTFFGAPGGDVLEIAYLYSSSCGYCTASLLHASGQQMDIEWKGAAIGDQVYDAVAWPDGSAVAVGAGAGARLVRDASGTWTSSSYFGGNTVWGLSKNDYWFSLSSSSSNLYHWANGSDSYQTSLSNVASLTGRSDTDLLAVGTGHTMYAFDGASWKLNEPATFFTRHDIEAVWGRSATDLYVAAGPIFMGWYVTPGAIFHWDGCKWASMAGAPSAAYLSGDATSLFASDRTTLSVYDTATATWSKSTIPWTQNCSRRTGDLQATPDGTVFVVGNCDLAAPAPYGESELLSYKAGVWTVLAKDVPEAWYAIWPAPDGSVWIGGTRYNGSFWTGIVRRWQNGIIFSQDIQGTVYAVTGIEATNVWFMASGSVHPISYFDGTTMQSLIGPPGTNVSSKRSAWSVGGTHVFLSDTNGRVYIIQAQTKAWKAVDAPFDAVPSVGWGWSTTDFVLGATGGALARWHGSAP